MRKDLFRAGSGRGEGSVKGLGNNIIDFPLRRHLMQVIGCLVVEITTSVLY